MPSFMRRVDAGAAEAARGAPSVSAAPAQEAVARKVRRVRFMFGFGLFMFWPFGCLQFDFQVRPLAGDSEHHELADRFGEHFGDEILHGGNSSPIDFADDILRLQI